MDIYTPAAGLIRMVVVNTDHFSNRYEELPLDAHTAIIAQNGSGKTTLMKLLPFFLGAAPSQVQSPATEKKNFINFYLPTDASYLACEYRNSRGQVRSVVVHTDPQKKLIQYRLVRGGLSKCLFVTEDEDGVESFVRNVDFEVNARRCGLAVNSRLITARRDYRGIIQGRFPEDSRQEKSVFYGLVDDFGIGRRSAPLDNIDQLFLTTLDSKFSLADLIAVVTNKVVDFSDRKIQILGGAVTQDTLSLVEDFRAMNAIASLEPRFREAETAETQRLHFYGLAKALITQIAGAEQVAAAQISEAEIETQRRKEAHQAALNALEEENTSLSRERAAQRQNIISLGEKIADIDREEGGLLAQGAEGAAEALAALPAMRGRQASIEQTLSLRDKGRSEIEEEHKRIVTAIKDEAREEAAGIDARMIEITEEIDAVRDRTETAAREHEAGFETTLLLRQEDLDRSIAATTVRKDDLGNMLLEVAADAPLVAERDRLAARLEEKRQEADVARNRAAASEKAFQAAAADLTSASRTVEEIAAKLGKLNRQHEALQARREPKADSLQAYLERNHSGWRESIGKLINEDLLKRTDLNPAEGNGDTLFGVSLDLDRITEGCPALETLEREQAQLSEQLAEVEHELAAARGAEARAASSRAKAVRVRDIDAAQADHAGATLKAAEDALAEAQAMVEGSIESRRAALREEIAAVRLDLEEKTGARRAFELEMRQKTAEMRAATRQKVSEAIRHLIEGKARLAARKKDHATDLRHRLVDEQRRRAELLAGGTMDAEAVHSLTGELAAIGAKLADASRLEDVARRWADFCEAAQPRRSAHRDAISVLEQEVEVLANRISANDASIKELKADHARQLDALDIRRQTLFERKTAATERLKNEQGDIELPENMAGCDPMSIPDLLEELRDVEQKRRSMSRAIEGIVRELRGAFNNVPGRIRNLHRDRARTLGNVPEGPRWLPIFQEWFDTGQSAMRETIQSQIGLVAGPIRESSRRLKEIEEEVSLVSRRLRAAIARLPDFPRVSEVDLSLRSRLRGMGFWGDMEEFVAQFEHWSRDTSMVEIDGLVEALEKYLSNWPVGANPEIDIRDALYIEGQLREGTEIKKLTKDTDIGKLSSTGGASIIRLIILTAAIDLIRDGSNVNFTWCVDEFGQLDSANSQQLIDMLTQNGITLVTGAPSLQARTRRFFANRISILELPGQQTKTLISHDATDNRRHGIREWTDEGELAFPMEEI